MKNLLSLILALNFLFTLSIDAASYRGGDLLFNDGSEITVNNRVLAYVNGKPITVLDVMKKMDMLFLKQFPEYTSSPQARYQYYQINWKHLLQELIDKELILADAEENKLPLSAGDIRQEMENLFGPNIIDNLDKIGLTFDEAFKIVQGDIMLRRMMMFRVNSKAMRSVTPIVIRQAYEDFAKKNVKQETFHYQVVTIRNNDATQGAETALQSYNLLTEDHVDLDDLLKVAKEKDFLKKSNVTVSDPFYHTENDVSDLIKGTLQELPVASYSKPIAQKSRSDKSTVFRIIYLKEKIPAGAVPYSEIENQLKDELYEDAIAKESEIYLKKLRHYHGIDENLITNSVPEDFQPFTLK